MAEGRDEVHSGNGILQQSYVKIRSNGIFTKWKKRWMVLKDSNGTGKTLMLFKNKKHGSNANASQSIPLENIETLEIVNLSSSHWGLNLHLRDDLKQILNFESENEAKVWHSNLTRICFSSKENDSKDDNKDSYEDNSHHCADMDTMTQGVDQFLVSLQPSAKLEMSGECNLQITPENIEVFDSIDPNVRYASWPIISMRRYGFDSSKFTFEAGRRCETGEGIFVFTTKEGENIHKLVQTYAQALALRSRDLPSANNNDSDELRPLPPLPTE